MAIKLSLVLSLIILASGILFSLHDRQRGVAIQAECDQLLAKATTAGLAPELADSAERTRTIRPKREDKEAVARQIAADVIARAPESGKVDETDFETRIASLNAAQLKQLFSELRAAAGLDASKRKKLLGLTLLTMANDYPQAALALFNDSADSLQNEVDDLQTLVGTALAQAARENPTEAFKWYQAYAAKFPESQPNQNGLDHAFFAGASANDPGLAVAFTHGMAAKEKLPAIHDIGQFVRTPEERSAFLAALRDYPNTAADAHIAKVALNSAMQTLASQAILDGFEGGSKWLAGAAYPEDELAKLFNAWRINSIKPHEAGRWAEWLGAALPPDKAEQGIQGLINAWTKEDYQAAGKWLTSTPDGPTKEAAVRAYAETTSSYEPETAAQWALTLPPGDKRDASLKSIYKNWPKTDDASKAAAAAFAQQHGIK